MSLPLPPVECRSVNTIITNARSLELATLLGGLGAFENSTNLALQNTSLNLGCANFAAASRTFRDPLFMLMTGMFNSSHARSTCDNGQIPGILTTGCKWLCTKIATIDGGEGTVMATLNRTEEKGRT